jgi:hypothetical protein
VLKVAVVIGSGLLVLAAGGCDRKPPRAAAHGTGPRRLPL